MGDFVCIVRDAEKSSEPFCRVSERLFGFSEIDFDSRLALAYMLGRPPGWRLYLGQVQSTLKISDCVWRKISRQLKKHGFLSQTRVHGTTGKIEWVNTITDAPLYRLPMRVLPTDGDAKGGKAQQKAEDVEPVNSSTKSCSSFDVNCTGFDELRTLVILENEVDHVSFAAMLQQHGVEAVKAEALALIGLGKRPYVSSIRKQLLAVAQKEVAARRKQALETRASLAIDTEDLEKGAAALAQIRSKIAKKA